MNAILDMLPGLGLCMIRPLGVLLLLPIFSNAMLGGSLIRNAMALMMALPLVPIYADSHTVQQLALSWSLVCLVLKELIIGLMLGFVAAIPFWAVDMTGFVLDTMRGSSMSSVLNPLLGVQSSVFGILFSQILAVIFLVLGGFNQLLESLYLSYRLLEPGATITLGTQLPAFFFHQWRLMFELCINFALPSIVVMILVDIGLGLINRSAQQLNVFFLAMPIKSILVLLLLITSLHASFGAHQERMQLFWQHVQPLLKALR